MLYDQTVRASNANRIGRFKTTGWNGTIRGKPDIGSSAQRTKRIDERDIELFAQITGDRMGHTTRALNPIASRLRRACVAVTTNLRTRFSKRDGNRSA